METRKRTIAKAFCWQAVGLVVMTVIGYVFTGSAGEGGALALVSAAVGLVNYFLHERAWARVRWGRIPGA